MQKTELTNAVCSSRSFNWVMLLLTRRTVQGSSKSTGRSYKQQTSKFTGLLSHMLTGEPTKSTLRADWMVKILLNYGAAMPCRIQSCCAMRCPFLS